jgi:hypothetical protein
MADPGSGPAHLSVCDAQGRIVFYRMLTETLQANVSCWAPGIYFARLTDPAAGKFVSGKITRR